MKSVPVESYATRVIDTPVGAWFLAATERGLTHSRRNGSSRAPRVSGTSTDRAAERHLDAASRALVEYFEGGRTDFDDLLLAPEGTEFQRRVWRALGSISYGETATYGRIAARIGRPGAARAVGLANGRNPIGIIIPCHRVIGADGSLTGYGGGLEVKAWLLRHEGALGRALFPDSPSA